MIKLIVGSLLLLGLVVQTVHAAEPPTEQARLVKGNTDFALNLYQQLRAEKGNLFLSPFSISSALAMTYAGAGGKTADEMAHALHFDLPQNKVPPAFGVLIKQVNGETDKKRGYQLTTANALWGQKSYPFQAAYLKLIQDSYAAGLHEVDFMGAPEAARLKINAWVEKETKDKIKDLLKPGSVNAANRLILTNAIYFKGDWVLQFKKERTIDSKFHTSAAASVQTPLMSQKEHFNYFENDAQQVLELPYAGKELTMVVLLPRKIDGISALEKDLTPANLTKWLASLSKTEVNVTLPRFKVTSEFSLKKQLSALGMPIAFSHEADFTNIASKEGLQIDDVVHKAYVDVNEEGTEAAAATGVKIRALAARVVPTFRADHPFVFLIRDTRSGSILFMGRLSEPK